MLFFGITSQALLAHQGPSFTDNTGCLAADQIDLKARKYVLELLRQLELPLFLTEGQKAPRLAPDRDRNLPTPLQASLRTIEAIQFAMSSTARLMNIVCSQSAGSDSQLRSGLLLVEWPV